MMPVVFLALAIIGCGAVAPTMTPTAAPVAPTVTPVRPFDVTPVPVCTPPLCRTGEVYHCPGQCPGGCGTQCATVTPLASNHMPAVAFFRANVTEANPGDTVRLEWQSSGGSQVTLYRLTPSGQFGEFWSVAPGGSMTFTIPSEARNYENFALYVRDDAGHTAQAALSVTLRCPDAWFFSPPPEGCPAQPAVRTDGAEQRFQHGLMLWNRTEGRIYVLYDDGRQPAWDIYKDEWDESKSASDPELVPPSGLYQPERGFGWLWRSRPDIRDRLGWASSTEQGYSTAVQSTSRPKNNTIYIRALDGGVWELLPERNTWRHIP